MQTKKRFALNTRFDNTMRVLQLKKIRARRHKEESILEHEIAYQDEVRCKNPFFSQKNYSLFSQRLVHEGQLMQQKVAAAKAALNNDDPCADQFDYQKCKAEVGGVTT